MSAEKVREFHIVNHSVPRRDGRVKVTGQAVYVSDVKLAGMAYAKVLRSPYAHARILSIDTRRALSRPKVLDVLTGKNLENLNPYFGHAVKDHPLVAIDKVRFIGEPVAAVIAEDERSAYEALEFIEVQYEEPQAVLNPQEAMAQGAPLLHDRKFEAGHFVDLRGRGLRAAVLISVRRLRSVGVTWRPRLPRLRP